jgi:hypothetical protein
MDNTLSGSFFQVNERKLDALIQATTSDMEQAETAILRRANDQYRKIIYNAQVYANTGAGTYEKAVDMATKDFLSAGIQCVVYKNGARHTLSDYAEMALRTASKRAYLQGEGAKRQEWGISTVIINKRNGACSHCALFCGKVFIDDVWSGGKASDGDYPLLSSAIEQGLYHPRCKDSHSTYFPGLTEVDKPYTRAQIAQLEQDEQREQRTQYIQRQAEKYQRLADFSLDEENQKKYGQRAGEWGQICRLQKPISVDEFSQLKELLGDGADSPKYRIADEIWDCVVNALERFGGMKEFDAVRVKPLAAGVVFDTFMIQSGTFYRCELHINGKFFHEKSLKEIQNIIAESPYTICQNLDDCVLHEVYHARSTDGAMAAVVNRINELKGVSGISLIAERDMLEALAEAGVLKECGRYDIIPEESREMLDEAAKELGLW